MSQIKSQVKNQIKSQKIQNKFQRNLAEFYDKNIKIHALYQKKKDKIENSKIKFS